MTKGERARVLLVTRNLPPLVGGMERLNWHMAAELATVADVLVVAPEGAAAVAPSAVGVCEIPLTPLWRFLAQGTLVARREARCWRPDVVLAGSGLTAPLALATARSCGARAVAYVHGLDVAVSSRVYRALWWRVLRRMDRVVTNSRATAALCAGIGIATDRIGIAHPGVALPDAAHATAGADFIARHGLAGHRLLLSVGRLTERKGLIAFVEHALPRIVARAPDAMLVVVGDAPRHALHARPETPERIIEAAKRSGVGAHVRFAGVITDFRELGSVYRSADVHVFPVRELRNDPEGFGMVAVEAAAHGLPTVAFATGGVTDAVAEGRSGHLVAPGDYRAFADAVVDVLSLRAPDSAHCEAFARGFAWPEFGRALATELDIGGVEATPP